MIILENLKTHYKDNPIGFVETIFDCRPQAWQKTALTALVNQDRIAIRSGHGVGKTAFLAWTIYWWLATRYPGKIACTAPTAHQLRDILWGELAKWRHKMYEEYRDLFDIKSDRIVLALDSLNSFAVARTARRDQPEAFQGFHSQNMLFIIDEASGVEEGIFEAGSGSMSTEGAKTLMVGNPTRASGTFYNCFHKARSDWFTMRVSCEDSPMVAKLFPKKMASQYGIDSNVYRVRVLGEFPFEDDDIVIPLYLCESAVHRDIDRLRNHPIIWGVDVARFGNDRTALAKRQGNYLLEPVQTWRQKDTTQIVGLIKREYYDTKPDQRPREICVDVIGFGAGVHDYLSKGGLPSHGINVAEAASLSDRYHRLRDELWFRARDWLQSLAVRLPEDNALIAELTSPRFHYDTNGKMVVEKKEEMKRRGIISPDLADAFCLTFAGTARPLDETIDTDTVQRYSRQANSLTWVSA